MTQTLPTLANMPADLPPIVYWRMASRIALTSLPHEPVRYISTSGNTNANIVRPQVPFGATGWRTRDDEPWKPLAEIPPEWLPFFDRPRPSEMDPRPPIGKRAGEK